MTAFGIWWCSAYGPPPEGHSNPDAWPRCFIHPDDGLRCSTLSVCEHTMAAERRRVFGRINEMAADGDEIAQGLAEYFTSPDMLLNSAEDAPDD